MSTSLLPAGGPTVLHRPTRPRVRLAPALLGALLLAGGPSCRKHPTSLADITVDQASLHDVQFGTVAVLGGVVTGSGILVVRDIHGHQHSWPVALRGGVAGLVVDVNVSGPMQNNRATLRLPAERVSANHLLGRYRGMSGSFVTGVGIDGRRLRNKHGVVYEKSYLSVGVGVHGGFEWVRIDITGGPLIGDPVDTADTGVTPPLDPDVPVDTGYAPSDRSSGCGCGGPGGDGDTAEPADTDTDTPDDTDSPDPSDPPHDPSDPGAEGGGSGGSSAGCCGGSGGSGCDDGSCDTRAASAPWWVVALVLPWVRRRRRPPGQE